jgi:hypothetical protein
MEFLKLWLPVVTFIAGYLLSIFDRLRESRRKLRNMKMIVCKEMSENYKLLNQVVPSNKDDSAHPDPIAQMAQRFSFAVYERYLDRLDQLPTEDLGKIYDAGAALKDLQSKADAFLAASPVAAMTPGARDGLAGLLIGEAPKCLELLAQALGTFPEGTSFLRTQAGDRGSSLRAYKKAASLS